MSYGVPTRLTDEKRNAILARCKEYIQHTETSSRQSDKLHRAALNQDFYRGAQWTREEWEIYRKNGVEPITINRCLPTVRLITGLYVQSKQDIIVRPNRRGSEAVAKVLSEIIKHAQSAAGAERLYVDLFKLGVIENESYIELTIDPDKTDGGQFELDVYESLDVSLDPDAKYYDLEKDTKYVILRKWRDKEEINLLYPDLHDRLNQPMGYDDYLSSVVDTLCEDHTEYDEETGRYRYKVRTIYWKEPVKGLRVTSKQHLKTETLQNEADMRKARQLAKQDNTITVQDVITYRLHKSVLIGDLLAEDTVNPFGDRITEFPVFRFAPHFDNGYVFGVLDSIRSLNKEENINRTQATRHLNQTVNGGWKIADGSNKQAVNKLQNYGAVPGLIIDESEYGGKVEKIEPSRLSDHFLLGEQSSMDVKEVSGLNDATHGYETARAESGRALILKQQQGRISVETIFANFYHTLEKLGQFMLKCIQHLDVYTDEEIEAVIGQSGLLSQKHLREAEQILMTHVGGGLPVPQPLPSIPPEAMAQIRPDDLPNVLDQVEAGLRGARMYAQEYPQLRETLDDAVREFAVSLLMQELKDAYLSDYSLTVTSSPSSPTSRLSTFAELEAIQEKYGIIPPDIFIEATDLPNKDEIIARLQQAQSAPPPAAPGMQPAPLPAAALQGGAA